MRHARTIAAVLVAVALLAGAAGCGKDEKTIPEDEAATLLRLLRDARDNADDKDKCDQLQRSVSSLQAEVQTLSGVDRDTRRTLVDGVNNLADTARNECENADTTETTPTVETTPPETTAPPETTPPETTPPETTPPQTTPPEATPPAEPQPPAVEPGNGNGNGNGGTPPGQEKKDKAKDRNAKKARKGGKK